VTHRIEASPFALSQNFFTIPFYLAAQRNTPVVGEGVVIDKSV